MHLEEWTHGAGYGERAVSEREVPDGLSGQSSQPRSSRAPGAVDTPPRQSRARVQLQPVMLGTPTTASRRMRASHREPRTALNEMQTWGRNPPRQCAALARQSSPCSFGFRRRLAVFRERDAQRAGQRETPANTPSLALGAEGPGFEPGRPLTRPNGFQDRRIQPLCHPSVTLKGMLRARAAGSGAGSTLAAQSQGEVAERLKALAC